MEKGSPTSKDVARHFSGIVQRQGPARQRVVPEAMIGILVQRILIARDGSGLFRQDANGKLHFVEIVTLPVKNDAREVGFVDRQKMLRHRLPRLRDRLRASGIRCRGR
ncbi:hypothetical protein [Croceicoccus naphthovorans]|uniref:hypothetical protein n=1 Tax=Croceicoccus naphthovorans TaxID=1348774 RepID=UPI0012E077EF|nr:hypothetical protein [Croceicoccus naphthovorans]